MDLKWERLAKTGVTSPVTHLFAALTLHMDSCMPQHPMGSVEVQYIDFYTKEFGTSRVGPVYRVFRNGGVDVGTPEEAPEVNATEEVTAAAAVLGEATPVGQLLVKEILTALAREFLVLGDRRATAAQTEPTLAAKFAAQFTASHVYEVADALNELATKL